MLEVLAEVMAGVVAEVATTAGRRIATAVWGGARSRKERRDEVIAAFTPRVGRPLARELSRGVAGLTAETAAEITEAIGSLHVRAVVHELVAARLVGAPDGDIGKIRRTFSAIITQETGGGEQAADAVFDQFDAMIRDLAERLAADEPDLFQAVRQDAHLARLHATTTALERHAAAVSGRADPAAEELFLRRYRRQAADYHGSIEPPDFDRRQRVPLADIYVTPRIVPAPAVETDEDEPADPVDLESFARAVDRTVLLGDPGGGKTSTSHALMHLHASREGTRTPFYVSLHEYAAAYPPTRSIIAHIEYVLEVFHSCRPPADLVERLLLTGQAIVIFDGLDELTDSARRADVASMLERFSTEFPLTAVMVTSRVVGYAQARLDQKMFTTYRISGFGPEETEEYVRKWFALEQADTAEAAAEDFMTATVSVPDLRSNPLMLALMCILYRGQGSIPYTRPEVYEQCTTLFSRRWDARRRIHTSVRAWAQVDALLRHLAYWLHTRSDGSPAVSRRALVASTRRFLLGRGMEDADEALAAAEEIIEFCRGRAWVFSSVGVDRHGADLYAFTHRTFMEYYAAAEIAGRYDSPVTLARRLVPRIARREWDVVAQLAVQIKDRTARKGAERIVAELLRDRRLSDDERENLLTFLCRAPGYTSVPQRQLRTLVGRAIEIALRPGEDGAVRLAPLGWLMYTAGENRAFLSREISGALADRILSEEGPRLGALRLALYLREALDATGNRDGLAWDASIALADRHRRAYGDAIEAMAPQAEDIAVEALLTRRIGLARFHDWHGPDLAPLFRSSPRITYRLETGLGTSRHRPVASELLGGPTRYDGDGWWDAVDSMLAELAAVTTGLGEPPWTDASVSHMDTFSHRYLPDLARGRLAPQSDESRAGLGIVLFTWAELEMGEIASLIDLAEEAGWLRDFVPYLRGRFQQGRELPALRVGAHFAVLFRRWAEGAVDFTRDRHLRTQSGGAV
ncbi:hypothetical protein Aph01nite_34800 [Acrocarpospora phusangensis]|uniref:NACHT domain-containing protein n=1 Tax=Acrocarpospora phusangensis TaxID=1070424 RepID=A0A919QD41_9ACTN|nr:NACHT domain-containing protein [Acrocarpospora phusangensis]GIH25170.1 hypothetical protein Aph01nite_34800 [Acrocarpospora phusangensis]